jgi:phytoene dehydrogenase-like protein
MDYDVLIVGGGHNGLVGAHYLAEAGLSVCVLERRATVGGACSTEELFPGYHFSTCAHSLVVFHPRFVDDMHLVDHGLEVFPRDPSLFQPFPNGTSLLLWKDAERAAEEIAQFSAHDALAYPRWNAFWSQAAQIFEPFLLREPPTLRELASAFEGGPLEPVLNRVLTYSVRNIVDEYFESSAVKSSLLYPFDVGTTDGAGSLLYAAFHASLSAQLEARGLAGYPRGGMGSVAAALRRSVESRGVEISTQVTVEEILVRQGRAVGVRTADGSERTARAIVSNADPRRTFLRLLDPAVLDPAFRAQVGRLHATAGYLKLHCAARGLPDWSARPGTTPGPQHFAQARLSPSLDVLDRAWTAARAGGVAEELALSVVVPTVYDPELAPKGHHTIMIWVEYVPAHPSAGSWNDLRERVSQQIIDQVTRAAPNFRDMVEDSYLYTPWDMEERLSLTDGSMHHLDMTPDQMLWQRPLAGWAGYRTPLPGLYLCGAGCHPGGGVTGVPGYNAAQVVLRDLL